MLEQVQCRCFSFFIYKPIYIEGRKLELHNHSQTVWTKCCNIHYNPQLSACAIYIVVLNGSLYPLLSLPFYHYHHICSPTGPGNTLIIGSHVNVRHTAAQVENTRGRRGCGATHLSGFLIDVILWGFFHQVVQSQILILHRTIYQLGIMSNWSSFCAFHFHGFSGWKE